MDQKTTHHPEKDHLDYIDGLKGVAILMVLFFHVSLTLDGQPYFLNFRTYVEHFSRGVHLFFIVSGFALFHSSRAWNSNRLPVLAFYIKRFFRIFPLWWLVVCFYHFYWDKSHGHSDFLATLFLYFGFFNNAWLICIVPVGWSLFIEECFYVFFPLWRKITDNLKRSVIAILVSYLVAIIWYRYGGRYFDGPHFLSIFPLGNYYAFFCGIFLYHLNTKLGLSSRQLTLQNQIILTGLCLISVILIFVYDRMVGSLALSVLFFASLFPDYFIGRIVRSKLLRHFGSCCYSIYLLHTPILGIMWKVKLWIFSLPALAAANLELQTLIWFIVVASFSLLIGKISLIIFERPSILLGKKLLKRLKN